MEKNETYFADDEIEEIEVIRDLCEGVTVDGSPLICFDVLYEIASGTTSMHDLPERTLVSIYSQIKGFNDYWRSVEWFDNEQMERLIPKIRRLIKSELDLRHPHGSDSVK